MTTRLAAVLAALSVVTSGQVLFFDDFEVGDLSTWDGWDASNVDGVGTTAAVVTSYAHSGLYSFRSQMPRVGSSKLFAGSNPVLPLKCTDSPVTSSTCASPSNYPSLYMRFYMMIGTDWTQSTGDTPQIANIGNGELLRLRKAADGKYYLRDVGGRDGTHEITVGVWHSIEMHSTTGTGDAVVEVWLDGVLDISASNLTTAGPLGWATYVGLDNGGTSSGSVYFDDVVVSTAPIGSPAAHLIVRYPNTAGRSGMPVDVRMWGQVATDILTARVNGSVIWQKSGSMTGHERFPVVLSSLAAGTYPFTVTLTDSGGTQKATWSTTIRKYKDGTPTVSIDEHNNISVNGQKIFPVSLFGDALGNYTEWAAYGAVNVYGWHAPHRDGYTYTPTNFGEFLDSLPINILAIGPDQNWQGRSDTGAPDYAAILAAAQPNAVDVATSYVVANRDKDMFMWTWDDEPDLGSPPGRVPMSRMRDLAQVTHDNDPNHPVILNMLGYEKPQVARQHGFYYPPIPSTAEMPMAADVWGNDTYPIMYQGLPDPQSWTLEKFAKYLGRLQRYTFSLTPNFQFIEAVVALSSGVGPTPEQLKMESWLSVIHGMKSIHWWMKQGTTSADVKTAAGAFATSVNALKSAILSGVSRTVTSNRTVSGARVDVAAWDEGNTTLVVAARLSEVAQEGQPAISTELTVSGITNTTATVYGESRTVPVVNGVITDNFDPYAVHIYQIGERFSRRRIGRTVTTGGRQ